MARRKITRVVIGMEKKKTKTGAVASPSLFDAANPLLLDASLTPTIPVRELLTERIFSVGDFLDHLNVILKVEDVFVRGEVTSMQVLPSGLYFSVKDKEGEGVLSCYMNPYRYRSSGVSIEDGMDIKIGGAPNIYKPKGRLSFVVETIELMGEGSLKKAYDLLKRKLEVEGLFERKRPLPEFARRIGIITSRTGAVIDDFRKNLERRGFELFFIDVRVEGATAVPAIRSGLRWFNKSDLDLDVVVLMRGGGSLEDLQAFNNELVARDIFALRTPTVCAIGHDRDVPIANLVGDRATSTPTAAAMLINASWQRLKSDVPQHASSLVFMFERALRRERYTIEGAVSKMVGYINQIFLTYKNLTQRFYGGIERLGSAIAEQQKRLEFYDTYLENVSPERNLRLGYSIVLNKAQKVVKSIKDVAKGEVLTTKLADGAFNATVATITKNPKQ